MRAPLYPEARIRGSANVACTTEPRIDGIQIAITDVSPTPQAMSKLMSMFVVSILATRATVPAAATSLFALGVDRHIAGGYLVWIVLALISAGLCLYMRWFPGNAKTRHRELEEPEEVERSIQ